MNTNTDEISTGTIVESADNSTSDLDGIKEYNLDSDEN